MDNKKKGEQKREDECKRGAEWENMLVREIEGYK
jgi:hypothetical protein